MMSIAELEINDRRFEFNLKLLKYLVSNLGNLKSDVPTADLSELLQPGHHIRGVLFTNPSLKYSATLYRQFSATRTASNPLKLF